MKATTTSASDESPESRLNGFIDKFDAMVARQIRSVRKALRKRLPGAVEMVYDNWNFFVIGYGPNERASDAVVSLVADRNGTSLCFIYGATLEDPKGLMQGGGNQVRFIKLPAPATLAKTDVKSLIRAAIKHGDVPMPKTK